MTRYIVANWKSYKTLSQAEKWIETFCSLYHPDPHVHVIIAPPAVYLAPLFQSLRKYNHSHLSLAAQDLSPYPMGSYTGAVAGDMIRNFVDYAIVGHSERRRYFHETNQEVAQKVAEAAAAEIKPILCVDLPYARAQIAALDEADMGDLVVGYCPVEAIGLDIPQSPEKIRAAVEEIQVYAPEKPIFYGGSINAANAGDCIAIEGISGLMVGTACLDAKNFAGICRAVSQP
ncbi:MAG: triosephosphate isomerase [Desulfobulbaceae bacterium]|uniref:Triosephosphate isomerase n=1 Tax=Candidatus Desulfobia pelagia TaxID=2841692 RepID=A0A8J6TG25_9BACT|nr:triosephosphate isomerase [Candidatus Desulfobia pelagia]